MWWSTLAQGTSGGFRSGLTPGHQFHRPIMCMKAGTNTIRITVASRKTASAKPKPMNCTSRTFAKATASASRARRPTAIAIREKSRRRWSGLSPRPMNRQAPSIIPVMLDGHFITCDASRQRRTSARRSTGRGFGRPRPASSRSLPSYQSMPRSECQWRLRPAELRPIIAAIPGRRGVPIGHHTSIARTGEDTHERS